ncbi:sulfotransferase family protein [Microbulbifer sp. JTAC008]|uniref:sulfotransferase family protein n=1 Tax=unclassified Microbulbifer TaxID=2619833 RepID=UPI0040396F28
MSVKIIGAGFGRTGTFSLKLALETLGFSSCLHMSDFAASQSLSQHWLMEMNKEFPDWKSLSDKYEAMLDWPVCLFVEEFTLANPSAKVIMTERDFDGWYSSMSKTVFPALCWANNVDYERASCFIKLVKKYIVDKTFSNDFSKDHARIIYYSHMNNIKEIIPESNILFLNVKDGWEPLCEFLSCEKPNSEFPKENKAANFTSLLKGQDEK